MTNPNSQSMRAGASGYADEAMGFTGHALETTKELASQAIERAGEKVRDLRYGVKDLASKRSVQQLCGGICPGDRPLRDRTAGQVGADRCRRRRRSGRPGAGHAPQQALLLLIRPRRIRHGHDPSHLFGADHPSGTGHGPCRRLCGAGAGRGVERGRGGGQARDRLGRRGAGPARVPGAGGRSGDARGDPASSTGPWCWRPAAALLVAVVAWSIARQRLPAKAFTELKAQLDADAQALRTLGAR